MIDINSLRTTVIASIQEAIGPLLSQTYNPAEDASYGTILAARPNPELPAPPYPYAVIDLVGNEAIGSLTTNLKWDTVTDSAQYESHKQLTYQVTIYADRSQTQGDSIQIANTLATSYRREKLRNILVRGGCSLASIEPITLASELLQTGFIEVSVVLMRVRTNDILIDPTSEAIEAVNIEGDLDRFPDDPSPLQVAINVDTTP